MCPKSLPADGLVVNCQLDAENFEKISKEPKDLCIEDEDVSIKFYQGSSDLSSLSSQLDFITFRRQQLHNRRIMLLKIKHFRNKMKGPEDLSNTASFPEESDSTELEEVEQELCDLVEREQELLQIQMDNNAETEVENNPSSENAEELTAPYNIMCVLPGNPTEGMTQCTSEATPPVRTDQHKRLTCQGVYVLPQCTSPESMPSLVPTSHTHSSQSPSVPPEDIVDVEKLHKVPAIVQCPFCKQVVRTKTYRKIGGAAWIICFVSGMLGCVAGCCLLPFFLDNLKDVCHSCPECHNKIYTLERM
ncbi:uncharacterized protein LOC105005760 [Esox lucius]|uniref:uncharacterized protein LOC105005760 n=1 Tax=Esox lucius TaxID=8010 RepID=UPI0014776515|nr:uncharacterized protein LOC105005760 [Esox lucius]